MNNQLLKQKLEQATTHIFDMDGTLVNLEELNFTTFEQTIQQKFRKQFTQQEYQEYFSGAGSRNGFIAYTKHHNLNYPIDELVNSYRIIKEEILNTRIYEVVTVKDGAEEYLNNLKQQEKKLLLATSSFYDFTMKILKAFHIYDKFEIILTERDITKNKPDPEIFNKARQLSGNPIEQCVIYEDSINGIKAAKASGIYCIGLHNPGLNDDYIDTADAVVESFRDLL
ncbi:MAG: HAD family phosphatase [Candidatus Dojkabacteria bacterium]|nr:MAG: HAD family phosphatase [Candidatus Dojkabacteria bacterium]